MLEVLNKYQSDGLLYSQTHPTLPLTIWNYTQKVQYDAHWDEVTLQCRGLVVDDMGTIVARPFKKFFNIEENRHTATNEFEIYEKMDGSLGIMFYYWGEWVFASRGSFTSEQALKFKEIFTSKYMTSHLTVTNTYMFEIIYPENRIVVNYGEMEDVIMLGEIHTESGEELGMDYWQDSIFNIVKKYDFKDYNEIQKLNWDNKEGFIVKFSNGDRCKIKFADYVKLHRVLTNCSSYDIWENLKTFGKLPEEMLKDVPDEFYTTIKEYEMGLVSKFIEIRDDAISECARIAVRVNDGDRKSFAELAKKYQYPGLLFSLLDGKDINQSIWDIIKPEYKKI